MRCEWRARPGCREWHLLAVPWSPAGHHEHQQHHAPHRGERRHPCARAAQLVLDSGFRAPISGSFITVHQQCRTLALTAAPCLAPRRQQTSRPTPASGAAPSPPLRRVRPRPLRPPRGLRALLLGPRRAPYRWTTGVQASARITVRGQEEHLQGLRGCEHLPA